jgi:hypothetical protein
MTLLLLSLSLAFANTTLSVGIDSGAVRDDLLVSLGFGGAGPAVGGSGRIPIGPGDLDLGADMSLRVLSSSYGQLAFSGAHAVDVRYLLRVSDPIAVGVAGLWSGEVAYLESWDDAHAYWLGSQWLGPAARWSHDGAHTLVELALGIGLVGGLGRPDEGPRLEKQDPLKRPSYWFTAPVQGERWATAATCQNARLDLRLMPADESRHWVVGLDTRLVRTTEPVLAIDLGATAWIGRTWGSR